MVTFGGRGVGKMTEMWTRVLEDRLAGMAIGVWERDGLYRYEPVGFGPAAPDARTKLK